MRNHSLYQAGLLTVLLQDLLSSPSFRHLGGRAWTVSRIGLMEMHFALKEDLDSLKEELEQQNLIRKAHSRKCANLMKDWSKGKQQLEKINGDVGSIAEWSKQICLLTSEVNTSKPEPS